MTTGSNTINEFELSDDGKKDNLLSETVRKGEVVLQKLIFDTNNRNMLLLIQPSSASSERIFSLADSMFNESQTSALEEMDEVSVVIRANNK